MRVGIVGCGVIAKLHIKHLLSQGHKIIGVVDKDRSRAEYLTAQLGLEKGYNDLSQLLEAQKPEVIHVTTPPTSHPELTIQALEANCHVLVEKPMALTLSEADKMIQVAQRQGCILCVAHTQHFVPVMIEAYKLLEKGILGKILSAEVFITFDPSTRKKGTDYSLEARAWIDKLPGGLCYDLAPHGIYLLLPFIGKIQNLYSVTRKTGLFPSNHPDEIRLLIEGEKANGVLGISLTTKPAMNYLYIYGTELSLSINLTTMTLIQRRIRQVPRMAAKVLYHLEESFQNISNIGIRILQVLSGSLKTGDEHGLLIRKFYQSIASHSQPPVFPEEGREVVRILEMIWGSK